jgi:hypothetical protein
VSGPDAIVGACAERHGGAILLPRTEKPDYLDSTLQALIGESVNKGWVSLCKPHRGVHKDNLKSVHEQRKDKGGAEVGVWSG